MRRSPLRARMSGAALCALVLLACVPFASAAGARSACDRELDAEIARLVEAPGAPDAVLRLYAIDRLARQAAWDGRVRATYAWVLRQPAASPVLKAHALWFLAGVDRAEGNLLGAAEKHRRLGLVTDWLIIGPFDNEGKSGFDAVYPPEQEAAAGPAVDLDAAYDGKERQVRWRRYPAGLGSAFVELAAVFRPRVNVAAYALVLVHSPVEQEAALRFGTDDATKIWLDGALAYADDGYHAAAFDQAAAGVVLRAGWNRLLVKVTQGEGPTWRFCFRITAPDGSALTGLRFEADPQRVKTLAPTTAARDSLRPVEVADPVTTFERLVESEPENASYHAALAALYRTKHAFDNTDELDIKTYERAIELDPDNWRYYEEVAPLYRDRNKQRDAYEKVVELNPRRAPVHVVLGHYYLQHEFYGKALAAFRAAVDADPADYRSVLGLADYKARFQHGPEVGRVIKRLRRRYPTTPVLVEKEVGFAAFPRRVETAEALCHAVLRTDAGHEQAHRTLLGIARWHDNLDGMLRELHTLQRFDPSNTGLLVEEAKLLGDAARFDEAIAVLERALAICPEDAEVLEQIGRYAYWADKTEQADQAWERSLAFRPQNAPLKEYVEHVHPETAPFEDDYRVDIDELLADQPTAEDYPDDGAVVMLNLRVHEVHPTGLANLFGQRVVKILSKKGVEDFRWLYVPFTPETQEVKIQAARVHKPSGDVVEAEGPYVHQISNPSGGLYYSYSAMYCVLSNVEPGDVVEFRYRRNTLAETNLYADYFGSVSYFRSGYPTQRFKVVYITPKEREFFYRTVRSDLEPTIVDVDAASSEPAATAGESADATSAGAGQRIYTWEATDLAKIKSEPNMPGLSEVTPYVHISTFRDWTALGDWYWGLVQDQFTLDNEAKEKVAEIVEGSETTLEKVTAIYNWVVKNTRYIGLEFGIHGHKPYKASKVFARGYGDCKDKASLMLAMLAEVGIDADLVLIRTVDKGEIEPFPASLAVFNHAILYVPELDLYLDGTAEFSGTRELPAGDQGATVLLVSETRRELTRAPQEGAEANVFDDVYTVTLGEGNDVRIEGTRKMAGQLSAYYRYQYQEEAKRRETLEKQWRRTVPNTKIEKAEFSDLKDLEQPVTYSYEGEVPDFLTDEPDGSVSFTLLLSPMDLTKDYAKLAEREHDVVFRFPWTMTKRLHYVLPEGAKVLDLPEPLELETEHLDCSIACTEEDGAVVVTCTVVSKVLRVPVDEYAAFRETCQTIDEKQSERIRISR